MAGNVTNEPNMTTEPEQEVTGGISPNLRIILAVITTLPVLINIFYIIVCFTTLKKKFHNLAVLTLCIGDSILSLSLTMYSSTKLIAQLATSVAWCKFQTFGVCYGLVITYLTVLSICAERYVVVKNYNVGALQFFERFKMVILGGSCALGFLFTSELTYFVPHEQVISKCTLPDLYGDFLRLFITFIVIALTSLMAGIIYLCVATSRLIWHYFFKSNVIHPFNKKPRSPTHLELKYVTMYKKEKSEIEVTEEVEEKINENREMAKKISLIVQKWKQERMQLSPDNNVKYQKPKPVNKSITPNSWEKRAFITTIVIAASTFCLTGPFVLSFWLDWLYGARYTSQKVRLILFIPLVLNSMANPFIYAWRIREIKQRIIEIFCCK